jgi:hypothetical protein
MLIDRWVALALIQGKVTMGKNKSKSSSSDGLPLMALAGYYFLQGIQTEVSFPALCSSECPPLFFSVEVKMI